MMPDKLQLGRYYDALRNALGGAIQKPLLVRLGNRDRTAVFVPTDETDTPEEVYVHELPGHPSFEGTAYIEGAAGIDTTRLIAGTRVKIAYSDEEDAWTVVGVAARLNSEFMHGVDIGKTAPDPVTQGQILPGLIDITDTPTMTVRVLASWYTANSVSYYIETQVSTDFTANIPATNGEARYALIMLDAPDNVLSYSYGTTFDASLQHQAAYSADGGLNNIFPLVDVGVFRIGWVRLVAGMTSIARSHIWAAQELITAGGSGAEFILTDDNGDVLSDDNGDVLTE